MELSKREMADHNARAVQLPGKMAEVFKLQSEVPRAMAAAGVAIARAEEDLRNGQ